MHSRLWKLSYLLDRPDHLKVGSESIHSIKEIFSHAYLVTGVIIIWQVEFLNSVYYIIKVMSTFMGGNEC